jgi:hypothetical protein
LHLRGTQPSICLFRSIHCSVEVVQVTITEKVVINDVPLPSCIVIRITISLSRKVKPLSTNMKQNITRSSIHLTSGWPNSLPSKFRYPSPPKACVMNLYLINFIRLECGLHDIPDQFMKSETSRNNGCHLCEIRHICVCVRIHQILQYDQRPNIHISLSINQKATVLSPTRA